MASIWQKTGLGVLFSAILYQWYLRDFLFVSFGFGRSLQSIDEFPYSCQRLNHERLEACEDLWLDDEARVLYAACSGSIARSQWNQGMSRFNLSGRRLGGSELIALNIDSPGKDGLYGLRKIKPVGYDGATGDGTLDLVGFDVEIVNPTTLRFWLINQRPPVDVNRKYLDASKIGANATIDIFELVRSENSMKHIKTVFDPAIYSPNGIAALGNGSFVISNDHSGKVGFRKLFDPIIGGGNVVHCPESGPCFRATTMRLRFPNGLKRGADGLIYVPSAVDDGVRVMEIQPNGHLKELDIIKLGMPVDNLAVDAVGSIYAAGLPKLLNIIRSVDDPFGISSPSTIWRITKSKTGYNTQKVLEDRNTEVLSGVTTARHDVKTGRLFMGAALTPYLMVCDPK